MLDPHSGRPSWIGAVTFHTKQVRARIDELKVEKATAQASLPKLGLAPAHTDPAAVLDQVPDLSKRLRNADDATKRALFDAFDLRVVYDKASHRLSISATLTKTVATMLRNGQEPLCNRLLRGWCVVSADRRHMCQDIGDTNVMGVFCGDGAVFGRGARAGGTLS